MNNKELSRVAKLYGLNEEEILRRHGPLLENNLQAFKDAMQDVIVQKISKDPNLLRPELKKLLAINDPQTSPD